MGIVAEVAQAIVVVSHGLVCVSVFVAVTALVVDACRNLPMVMPFSITGFAADAVVDVGVVVVVHVQVYAYSLILILMLMPMFILILVLAKCQ